jgi:hypothetical protein
VRLSPAQRSLVFLSAITLPFITVIRSWVLESNDFGWRGALIFQFGILLLASELFSSWTAKPNAENPELPRRVPAWLRSFAYLALLIGVAGTASQALMLRFYIPLGEGFGGTGHNPQATRISHNAYISAIGYSELDARIASGAIVQYNPAGLGLFGTDVDMTGSNHQAAMFDDHLFCGSVWGGDDSGCPDMRTTIDALYAGAQAGEARDACARYSISYLVARVTDPAWQNKNSWVWTLPSVVADEDFRALDCRAGK